MRKKYLNILVFGDIFGSLGRKIIKEQLPVLKKKYQPDLIIANGENLTHGSGLSLKTVNELFAEGVDVITGGNHSFDNQTAGEVYADGTLPVLRPANMSGPGKGSVIIEKDGVMILVASLIGRLFMDQGYENPFQTIEGILNSQQQKPQIVVVDMHGEATSEKAGMANFLDGRASLVYGTHTHVPTADERILAGGIGFITDVGMTGPYDSVIGFDPKAVAHNFSTLPAQKIKAGIVESGRGWLNCLVCTISIEDGHCLKIERVNKKI